MSLDFTGVNIGSMLDEVAIKAPFTLDALNPESLTFENDFAIQILLNPGEDASEDDKIVAQELRNTIAEMKMIESTWNFYLAEPVVQLMMGKIYSHQGDAVGTNTDQEE